MDDYLFRSTVQDCRYVPEATSYIEILNYSDPAVNSVEEHPLTPDEFDNFVRRRGVYSPPKLKNGVTLQSGIRLVVQKNAKHPETFTPNYITLQPEMYESMVRAMKLPFRAIESMSVVGPFFWSAHNYEGEDPHLQICFRKSDVRKKGKTRGWELMLSHSFKTHITTGFVKGTASSDIVTSLEHLCNCAGQVYHPLLLPIIILSHDLSAKTDQKQRDARDWLRKLEHAVTMRNDIDEKETYIDFDLDAINRDLVECHSQVLWKRPQAYQEIIKEIKVAMGRYWDLADEEAKLAKNGEAKKLHESMMSRLDFYRIKLVGIENYAHTTLERLTIQRQALYNIIAQKESKLNLEMAAQQRRLAHASKRDSTAMKTISLLGAVFLPGTFLSSIFSMSFFDFNGSNGGGGNGDGSSSSSDNTYGYVSQYLWVYFIITVPLTMLIVGSWWFLERRREKRYAEEDEDIEKGILKMEDQIMAVMRQRTIKKATTWASSQSPSEWSNKKEKDG